MAANKPSKPSAVNYLNLDTPIEHAFQPVGDAQINAPKWIIKNVIPTGLTLYISPPKQFKSTTLLHWALRCLGKNSTALPEHLSKCERPGPVIMISTETTAGTIKFDALFGLRVHILSSDPLYAQTDPFAFRLDNPDNMLELLYWLKRIKPSMLVIDPLRNSHGVDENDAGEMVQLVQPLQQYAIKNDMALVIVHHMKKPPDKAKAEDMLKPDMARGTGALFGLADGLLSQIVTGAAKGETLDEDALPQLIIAGTFKRGKPLWEEVELNVEWTKMKLDVEIAANVYNIILDAPCTLEHVAKKLALELPNVLKYTNYMYKNDIIKKTANGKGWEVEHG